jgi:hypothetical protein
MILVPIQWNQRRAWVLVPTGKAPDESALQWMQEHYRRTNEPHMIKLQGRVLCYGSVDFQRDMKLKELRGETPW